MTTNQELREAIQVAAQYTTAMSAEDAGIVEAANRAALSQPPAPEQASGYALAMAVLQSDLYHKLDDLERAECDAMLAATPTAEPAGEAGGIKTEHGIAWQASAAPQPCNLVMVDGRRWYRDDHPALSASPAAPEAAPQQQAQGEPPIAGYLIEGACFFLVQQLRRDNNEPVANQESLITLQSHREAIALKDAENAKLRASLDGSGDAVLRQYNAAEELAGRIMEMQDVLEQCTKVMQRAHDCMNPAKFGLVVDDLKSAITQAEGAMK